MHTDDDYSAGAHTGKGERKLMIIELKLVTDEIISEEELLLFYENRPQDNFSAEKQNALIEIIQEKINGVGSNLIVKSMRWEQ